MFVICLLFFFIGYIDREYVGHAPLPPSDPPLIIIIIIIMIMIIIIIIIHNDMCNELTAMLSLWPRFMKVKDSQWRSLLKKS